MATTYQSWQLGGFEAIARRHGERAHEVRHLRALADEHGQLLFGWAEPTPDEAKATTGSSPERRSRTVRIAPDATLTVTGT